jgi:hypothetical protein
MVVRVTARSLGLLALVFLGACDSGFTKVAAAPEPEPEQEPAAEPVPVVDAAPEGFVAPASSFEAEDDEAPLSELGNEQFLALCLDQQRRLDESVRHFSEDEQLCHVIAVMEATVDTLTTSAYNEQCDDAEAECIADGPLRSLADFVPAAVTDLACDTWSTGACDPTVAETLVCFDDVVENLVQRLSELAPCTASRSDALESAARVRELEAGTSPFVLSNRCAAVACLLTTDPRDAGN